MKILFVCTGNTCRSCMAEAIFNNTCSDAEITAASAGVSIDPGSKASRNAVEVTGNNLGISIQGRCAVQLTEDLLKASDLVLAMTNSHKKLITGEYPQYSGKIYTLNEYVGVKGDINDPYGGDIAVYQKTFRYLKHSIDLLLDKLKEDRSIC